MLTIADPCHRRYPIEKMVRFSAIAGNWRAIADSSNSLLILHEYSNGSGRWKRSEQIIPVDAAMIGIFSDVWVQNGLISPELLKTTFGQQNSFSVEEGFIYMTGGDGGYSFEYLLKKGKLCGIRFGGWQDT